MRNEHHSSYCKKKKKKEWPKESWFDLRNVHNFFLFLITLPTLPLCRILVN